MAALGLTLDDIEEEEVEIWPDSWRSLLLFEAMRTQWRLGQGGPSGLDYTAVQATASMLGIKRHDLGRMFPDLRIMEHEALAVMAEERE